jgi:hypothetical protein
MSVFSKPERFHHSDIFKSMESRSQECPMAVLPYGGLAHQSMQKSPRGIPGLHKNRTVDQ